jgi:small subunit ribosomal protein S6
MREYETVFLISPSLTEEETKGLITQMADIITEKKGKMVDKEEWGKRKLAYPISKFEEAFYVLFRYEGESEIPAELERRFKQADTVIRYLTVRKETRENIRRKKMKPTIKEAEASAKAEDSAAQKESSSDEEAKEE